MARKWDSIICYEDRSDHLRTTDWRLSGIKTKEGAQNTGDGLLWLKTTKSGDVVTAELYKDSGLASANKVASGTANVAACDGTGENAATVTFAEAESSGLTGTVRILKYEGDDDCGVQVALCVDEDMDALWDGIEALTGYDSTYGCAESIRVAGGDVMAYVSKKFRDELGGVPAASAWFIGDGKHSYPDLRRIANPAQLRQACAYRALVICIGRSHMTGEESMYSKLRDEFDEQYGRALHSLVLALKGGSADDASDSKSASAVRQVRV